jgi:SAM-dependent methyltransferase
VGDTTHWTSLYEQRSTTDVSWYQPAPTISLELLDAAGVTALDPILDVGGGASVLVDHLIQHGFRDISVLDIARPALDAARRRLGSDARKVTWIATDLLTWKPDRRYRVWHDRAVFHFLTTSDDRARYVAVLRHALAPDGYAVIGTFAADGPRTCSGLPVARYASDALAAQFAGFVVRESRREEHHTPSGAVQPFTWVLLAADRPR